MRRGVEKGEQRMTNMLDDRSVHEDGARHAEVLRLHSLVSDLDLTGVKSKLCDYEEGLGLDADEADLMEEMYKRFLALLGAYPDLSIAPSKPIDQFWHQHILDTRAYQADCEHAFGHFMHHDPYFGLAGPDDALALQDAFDRMVMLTRLHFGDDMPFGNVCSCSRGSCRCD
jgi:hypothetical protein